MAPRGRAPRWTESQVQLLRDTVQASATASEAFRKVAHELGKSPGTVQQKWYALQRAAGTGRSRVSQPLRKSSQQRHRATPAAPHRAATQDLRALPVDDLIALAREVKAEIERRRKELDEASKLFG